MRTTALALTFLLAGAIPGPAVAHGGDRVDVLIQFRSPPTQADVAAVERLGASVSRTFGIVPAVAASVPSQALAALTANPRVALVEPDSLLYALEYRSTHDWGIGHINADDVHRQATPNRGAGVTVAVLDSGIDCDHLELPQDRCDYGQALGENFVDASLETANEADDDYGHGTHVAGTIAASLNQATGGVVGVAPDAKLVALKTLDSSGSGSWSRHIAAIEHVWNGGARLVDVVNMSIGRGDYSSTAELAMQRAYDSGILLVAAAGNSGKCSGRGTNLAYPALFESVIAVAAVDSSNSRPCWSSTGDKVELTAPGVSVFSTWPKNMSSSYRDPQPVCEDGNADGSLDCHYKYGSGTSMSSPHVAGTAALVLASGITDADGLQGRANEVRARLAHTAIDLGTAGRDPQHGHGLVDAAAAVGATTDPGDGTNAAPTASFTYSCTDLACNFDGSGSTDSDGTIATYAWDFGDGTSGTGATPTHTYASGDTYTVTLTVTDDGGATDSESKTVSVTEATSAPISLSVTGSKVRGEKLAALTWTDNSGIAAAWVDILRDGAVVETVANDGEHNHSAGTGGGSHVYQVCHAGATTTCSNEVRIDY